MKSLMYLKAVRRQRMQMAQIWAVMNAIAEIMDKKRPGSPGLAVGDLHLRVNRDGRSGAGQNPEPMSGTGPEDRPCSNQL
jgi:hypothetical protein